jgi:cytochrome P450
MARHDDGTAMADALIADEVRTLSVAGYETVAEAITWSIVLLSQHEHTEAAVRDEAASVTSMASAASFRDLGLIRMVMSEAMRLYPPSWLIVRVAVDDDVLSSGTRIPRGSRIYISPWVIHRIAKYHPDPERFDPMRFTADAIASRPRLTYLPFGAGVRQCIGENLAWLEGVLVLAVLHRIVRLARTDRDPVRAEPNVTLRPSRPVLARVLAA